ncbi:MAG: polysaccharide deacetylase family protein [Deltaproteobacteria bacterium]|nr:polysaccharide deacetylase family protein [Deltaproteobacteria bacterium]MBI3386788.1 polysaccharide deacetylase family protein [Deltaproteobacteria bacterium]
MNYETLKALPGVRPAVYRIRRWRDWISPGAVILAYHRIAEPACDPHGLTVSPREFAEQMEVLRRYARPMRLHDVVNRLNGRSLPRDAVAVTLDDGYADNLHAAKPILERFDIPATCFVTTSAIDSPTGFWWDEVARAFLQPTILPPQLCLTIGGRDYRWSLDTAPIANARAHTFQAVRELVRVAAHDEQQRVLAELRAWSGVPADSNSDGCTLTLAELQQLAAGELVEIGAHTLTHPVLSTLAPDAQRAEIAGSKHQLEQWLGRPVTSFAYPYGGALAFNATSVTAARAAGFTSACVLDARRARRGADPFRLSRVMVSGTRKWTGDQFARWLQTR